MRRVALLLLLVACSRDSQPAPKVEPAPVAVAPTKPEKKEPPRPAELAQVTVKALGMYCEESCPLKVRYALADITAVYELGFDLSTESIFISYDASLGTPEDVTKPMIAAIKQAGFDPWLSPKPWPADAKVQVVLR